MKTSYYILPEKAQNSNNNRNVSLHVSMPVSKLHYSRCNLLPESYIMLHDKHGRLISEDQILNLHPGKDINIVERFIPDI